jgi:hypothetical protein
MDDLNNRNREELKNKPIDCNFLNKHAASEEKKEHTLVLEEEFDVIPSIN